MAMTQQQKDLMNDYADRFGLIIANELLPLFIPPSASQADKETNLTQLKNYWAAVGRGKYKFENNLSE